MNELEFPDLFEAAARATINERCAPAFLHDVRGSMQALFSALELLGRSAKLGGDNALRVEKACDLAKRAISHHEKSTMDVLQLLTLQHSEPTVVDAASLVSDVVHFLRNDAASKEVKLTVLATADVYIRVERAKLHMLLVGLLTAAIDHAMPGTELSVTVKCEPGTAVVTVNSDCGLAGADALEELVRQPQGRLSAHELTLVFASQFLRAHAGRLAIESTESIGRLRLYYPHMTI